MDGRRHPEWLFFNKHQAKTIEAAMERLIPTDQSPGATDAGTVRFLDRYLSGLDYVYARPDGKGFIKLHGKTASVWSRRIAELQRKYREGIEELDRRSEVRYGAYFHCLKGEEQDCVLQDMETQVYLDEGETDKALSHSTPHPGPAMQAAMPEQNLDFFHLLLVHTRQGYYADPIYGGNVDYRGWRAIGFPGPRSLAEVHQGLYDTLSYFAPPDDSDRWE